MNTVTLKCILYSNEEPVRYMKRWSDTAAPSVLLNYLHAKFKTLCVFLGVGISVPAGIIVSEQSKPAVY